MSSEADVKTESGRSLDMVRRELADAEAEMGALRRRVSELRTERDQLAVASAAHPWLGRAVKRTTLVGYSPKKKAVTNRGTVAAYDPKLHRRLRALSTYNLEAGEPIVIHSGGQTGWLLNEFDWHARQMKCVWELDES